MMRSTLVRVLALGLCLAQGGCALGYYTQAARGQLDVLSRREPIESMLADPALDDSLRERLATSQAIRDFASSALALPENDSYRSYADLERDYVVWNVVAAPEFSVEPRSWCYPFVGCVSYRGYFSEARARAFAERLAEDGLDVSVAGVPAYSTLGKFADPLLNTMLFRTDRDLAAVMFHELAHQQVYARGDAAFSEAFATLVEREGVARWLAARLDGRERQRALDAYARDLEAADEFARLVGESRDALRRLYARPLGDDVMRAQKADALRALNARFRQSAADNAPLARYSRWFAQPLNNAHLAAVATYNDLVPEFRAILDNCGGDLKRFYQRAEALAEESDEIRSRQLRAAARDRSC